MSQRSIGILAASTAAILYGTSWVATGVAERDLTPLAVAIWRGALTALALLPFVVIGARRAAAAHASVPSPASVPPRPMSGRVLRYFFLALTGGLLFVLGLNVAVQLTGATVTAFVAGAYPVVAAALAPFVLREPLRLETLVGLGLAFVGAVLLASLDFGGLRLEGLLVAVGAAVSVGFFLVFSRKWTREWGLRSETVTFSNFALLFAGSLVIAAFQGVTIVPAGVSRDTWLAILWLALPVGIVATILIVEGVRRLPASESSAFLMLNPLTAALLAAPILGETLSGIQLLGAVLVLVGIGVATGVLDLVDRRVTRRSV